MKKLLHTSRLILRQLQHTDARAIFTGYASDIEACKYLTFQPHRQIEDTHHFITRCATEWADQIQYTLAICDRDNQELMGLVSYRQQASYRISFGYALNREKWGNGYICEAVQRLIKYAFQDPEIWRVDATCDIENKASARVMEKCGLQREGILKCHTLLPNRSNKPRDMYSYARIKP